MAKCASSSSVSSSSQCSVCLEDYTDPRVLPCCHSYCLKCLEGIIYLHVPKKLTLSVKLKAFNCPQCRAQHQVPPNGAKGFLEDYTIKKPVQKGQTQLCEQCEEGSNAVGYCNMCCDYLCERCYNMHKQAKPLRGHEISTKPKKVKRVYHCSKHPDEELKLYCKGCQVLACTLCFVDSHNGHDIGSINQKTRQEVETSVDAIKAKARAKLMLFEKRLAYICSLEAEKTGTLTPLKKAINKRANEMIAEIEVGRKHLLQQAEQLCTEEMKEIWSEKEVHETTIAALKSALAFTERLRECNEDTEVLALGKQVQDRLKALEASESICQLTEKAEMSSIAFKESAKQPRDIFGDIVPTFEPEILIKPSYSRTKIRGRSACSFTVEAYARPSTELNVHVSVHGRIKSPYPSMHTQETLTPDVKRNGSKWTATCTPSKSGNYTVTFNFRASFEKPKRTVTKQYRHEFEYNLAEEVHRSVGDNMRYYT